MIKKINLLLLSTLITVFTFGQSKLDKNHPSTDLTCKTCHSCEVPTRKDPCLNPCPRAQMVPADESPDLAPEVEVLKELSNRYMPVVFPHKLHAQMSEMSGGCKTCHHYNTTGLIQPCKNCHNAERKREDLSKPDLEAAYHRQCINCHREWSHENNCVSCHALKNSKQAVNLNSTIEKISGKSHPKIEEPKKIVFETNYNKGKFVTFYHDEHVNGFGVKCISCHKNENCTQCHDKGKTTMNAISSNGIPVKIHKSADQHHKPCFTCHQDDNCTSCHKNKETGPFNHQVTTGWALNRFHKNLACSNCHGSSGKYEKLNPTCTNCHKNFVSGKFDHAVTGLKLSENHSELDCDNCHQNKDFSKVPTCTGCHDDKSFPKDKPGKEVDTKKFKRIKLSN
jgi:hypothetical protein